MSIKEKFEQLRWEWMQSLGRRRYFWRCVFAWMVFGAFMYPLQQGAALVFGYGQPDPGYPSWAGFFWSVFGGAFGGCFYGVWMWSRYERKYRATSNSIPAA